MQLDGPEFRQLQQALINAYPTRSSLEQMVFHGLGVHLDAITAQGGLEQVVFELLRWAQAQGRLKELIVAAVSHNPGNQELQRVAAQLGVKHCQVLSSSPVAPAWPRYWNIPYPRNPFFTGQEAVLTQISTVLKAGQATALSQPQAISGLGGIGKTQIALEFVYQHRQEYEAVLWVLADTRESLVSGYIAIAQLLNLPQKDEQDQQVIVQAMKAWLQKHSSWLLILDNADELAMVREFVPASFGGRILLTTRAQSMGRMAKGIEVETMSRDVGALFLLRRAGLVAEDAQLDAASSSDAPIALQISEELGGLPLALDQAGAFIEQSQCSLSDYLNLYRTQRAALLARRGGLVDDHREPVATTWSMAFGKVEQKNLAAADLLRFCAFVHPDTIPEEMIIRGVEHLSSSLQEAVHSPLRFNDAITALLDYSLMRRNVEEKTLSVHRLVQAVLSDAMKEQEVLQWVERASHLVDQAFPQSGAFEQWDACAQYLPHVLASFSHFKEVGIVLPEVADMFRRAGWYLGERGQFSEAEELLGSALRLQEQGEKKDEMAVARAALALAWLYNRQGKYAEAEPLFQQALSIMERQLGPMHPLTATSLNNLAELYRAQGKYESAEPLYQRALAIYEEQLGPAHPDTAQSLNNLALLYYAQGKYEQALPVYERALAIYEEQLGPMHPDTARSLNNLALLYYAQGKYEQALPLYQRALAIREEQLGPMHPDTAISLNNLALLYHAQGKYERAEPVYQRALAIYEEQLGPTHPNTAQSLNNLASLYWNQGKYEQALPVYERALAIYEEQLGPTHPDTAQSLHNLATLYDAQGKYNLAEPLFQRALTIFEQTLGPDHPYTQGTRQWYDSLLSKMGTAK